jgi:hypothetical protein
MLSALKEFVMSKGVSNGSDDFYRRIIHHDGGESGLSIQHT